MLEKRSTKFWLIISFLGMMAGSALGGGLSWLPPETSGALETFFAGSVEFSIGAIAISVVVIIFSPQGIGFRLN